MKINITRAKIYKAAFLLTFVVLMSFLIDGIGWGTIFIMLMIAIAGIVSIFLHDSEKDIK